MFSLKITTRTILFYATYFAIFQRGCVALRTYNETDIDLNTFQSGSAKQYYAALIMFYNAMNSRLIQNLNPVISLKLEKSPDIGEGDFGRVLSSATKALEVDFQNFWSQYKDYSIRVYHFRLLEWLRFRMRLGTNKNPDLEKKIDHIIENHCLPAKVLLIDILHRDIESSIRSITTLKQLKNISPVEDEIMDFCFKLAKSDVWKPSIPYCRQVELYENLLNEINDNVDNFYMQFKLLPCNILIKVYEARRVPCNIKYQRLDGTTIIVYPEDVVKYYRDVITLFEQAMEVKLYAKIDEYIFQSASIVENFPTGNPDVKNLKISALAKLHEEILKIYDGVIKTKEDEGSLDDNFRAFYGRLLIWSYVHIDKVGNNAVSMKKIIKEIILLPRAGYSLQNQENLQKFKRDLFLEIINLEDLMKFCESGTESILDRLIVEKTINSLYQDSETLSESDLSEYQGE